MGREFGVNLVVIDAKAHLVCRKCGKGKGYEDDKNS
jgi:hypothetical protein